MPHKVIDEEGVPVSAGPDRPSWRAPAALFILDAENVLHDRRHWPIHECETTFSDCPKAWHERVVTAEELPERWEACRECLGTTGRASSSERFDVGHGSSPTRVNYGGPR